jgi:hypothetical protein
LRQYRDARYTAPVLHAVIQTAIDWARVGMPIPIAEDDLIAITQDVLLETRPELRTSRKKITKAVAKAGLAPEGAGRVAALETLLLGSNSRGYAPFSYLVAADDGQMGGARPVPDSAWDQALRRANASSAFVVSSAAFQRNNLRATIAASTHAANAGHVEAMHNLGVVLSTWLDPPDLDEARRWYTTAAEAGHTGSMSNLGTLLSDRLDPPELVDARRWYTTAAEAGEPTAMNSLGVLLASQLDPPELEEARRWFTRGAHVGDASSMFSLGLLLSTQWDPPELDEARRWYTQAAQAGDTHAMVNLGLLLVKLWNPPELDEARHWFTKAAFAGEARAIDALLQLHGIQPAPWE